MIILMSPIDSFSCLYVCLCVCLGAGPVPSGAAVQRLQTHPRPPGEHRRVQRSRGAGDILWPSVCPVGSTSLGKTRDQCEQTTK